MALSSSRGSRAKQTPCVCSVVSRPCSREPPRDLAQLSTSSPRFLLHLHLHLHHHHLLLLFFLHLILPPPRARCPASSTGYSMIKQSRVMWYRRVLCAGYARSHTRIHVPLDCKYPPARPWQKKKKMRCTRVGCIQGLWKTRTHTDRLSDREKRSN